MAVEVAIVTVMLLQCWQIYLHIIEFFFQLIDVSIIVIDGPAYS